MLDRIKHQLHRRQHRERYRMLDELLRNQTLSRAQLLVKQQQDLSAIIQHAYNNTPYYHEKYSDYFGYHSQGLHPEYSTEPNPSQPPLAPARGMLVGTPQRSCDPSSNRGGARFALPLSRGSRRGVKLDEHSIIFSNNLPILHKNEVVQHKDAMLARDIDRKTLSIGNTGGSTGKPVSFYYDQHKHELMRAGMIRSYMWSGWQPGQKILNFWGARQDIQLGGSLGKKYQDYIAAEETIAAYEYTGAQLETWAQTIRNWRPVLLQGYASILAELARYILDNKTSMPKSILGVYSTAEVLNDRQRKLMEQAFSCKVFNQYGSREIPNIACECRHGNQHVFTDMVYLESQQINQEERLIITSLTNQTMPFIRYDIGDSGRLKEGGCPCGSPFPLMEIGLCRSNDLIKTSSGKVIHPSCFNRLLYGQTDIRQYQYIQNEPDKIILNIVSPKLLDFKTVNSLKESVRREIDEKMVLEINYVDEIKRSISGKHRFVISNL